jgi:hypothetical protein
MKKFAFVMVGAAAIALSGCGGKGDDAVGDNVQENMENQADNLDAMAGNAATDAEAEALGNQADQLRDEGNAREEATDNADVNAAEADSAVNGM